MRESTSKTGATGEFPSRKDQFKPGTSGNPGGRPKHASLRTAYKRALTREVADEIASAAIKGLLQALAEDPSKAVSLMRELNLQVDGAPVQGTDDDHAEDAKVWHEGEALADLQRGLDEQAKADLAEVTDDDRD